MSSYEEIKILIEKKDFQGALLVALSNSLKFTLTSKINNNQETSSIETEIDLLKGITTKASKADILTSDNDLMRFHSQQLENVHLKWQENRQVLASVLQVLAGGKLEDIPRTNISALNGNQSFLEEAQNNGDILEQNAEDWLEETPIITSNIEDNLSITSEEEEIIVSPQQSEETEASWDEFMDDLSAEEEAVSEEVIVDEEEEDIVSNEEISEDWSEWLDDSDIDDDDDDNSDGEMPQWNEEDWQEGTING